MASKRLGQILTSTGLVDESSWHQALAAASADGAPVTLHLVLRGLSWEELMWAISGEGVEIATADRIEGVTPELAALLPAEVAMRFHAMPVSASPGVLDVAFADPFDEAAIAGVRQAVAGEVRALGVDPALLCNRLEVLAGHGSPGLPRAARPEPTASRSIDDEIAELFGEEPEPVINLTRRKPVIEDSAPPPKAEPAPPPKAEPAPPPKAEPAPPPETEPTPSLHAVSPMLGPREVSHHQPKSPEPGPTLQSTVQGLRRAASRDEIAQLVLAHLRGAFDRAAILRTSSKEVRGWVSAGMGPADAIDELDLPLDTPSTPARVIEERSPRIGPLEVVPGDGALCSLLSPPPTSASLIPVIVADRVVCILFGDTPDGSASLCPSTDELVTLATEMGRALEELIRRRKGA